MYLSYEEMFIFAQQPLPFFLYDFPQGKSCVGVPMPSYNDFMISLLALSILDVSSEAR